MELENLVQAVTDSLFVELEASGRHVHVTGEQAMTLFGHPLTPARPLSQPGQFLARERVTLVGEKGEFRDVAVLGPERREGQVEISLTDGRVLGIGTPCPPVRGCGRDTGDCAAWLERAGGINPGGDCRQAAHSPDTPAAAHFGVKNGENVKLKALTRRPVIFEDVSVRVSEQFAPFAHLDYDEANACGFCRGDLGRILK